MLVSNDYIALMDRFDYDAPAELFISKSRSRSRHPVKYRRFATGAEAVRFAIEELPTALQAGTVLQIDEARFDLAEIRGLYESAEYPLPRTSPNDGAADT